jgi:hypothetical protein
VQSLFPTERRDWLVQVLLNDNEPSQPDERFALFGLWALSHLDEHAPTLNPLALSTGDNVLQFTVPTHLRLGPGFDWDAYVERIDVYLGEVFADSLRLVEVQSDYRLVIAQTYRRDYFAVPVAPVALSLSARYHPNWLFRRAAGRVSARATAAVSNNSCAPIPYQLSAGTNGVVFMSYLLSASCAMHRAMGDMSGWQRVRHWLPAATYRDNPLAFAIVLLLLLLAGPGAYFIVESRETAFGVWIGAWLGFVLNIGVAPINNRLWRADR